MNSAYGETAVLILLAGLILAVLAWIIFESIRQQDSVPPDVLDQQRAEIGESEGPKGEHVIGEELAAARENERRRLAQRGRGRSPLPEGEYPLRPGEWGLVNPVPSDLDARLRESCREFSQLGETDRSAYSAAVSADEFYTLIMFSRRSAVFALRQQDAELLKNGLTALAMIELSRTDYRDILDSLSLLYHAAAQSGVNPDRSLRSAADLAEPEMARLIIGFSERDPQGKALRDSWGYYEVETESGLGFARWMFEPYEPQSDLPSKALQIASVIERDSYVGTSIGFASPLPEVWLNSLNPDRLREALRKVKAVVSITASLRAERHLNASDQELMAFLVEFDELDSVQYLQGLSRSFALADGSQLAVASGRLFCLVVARSFVGGVESFEQGDSLKRFKLEIEQALGQAPEAR